jgi:O-antigen ligase
LIWVIDLEFNFNSSKLINVLIISLFLSNLIILLFDEQNPEFKEGARLGVGMNANFIGLYSYILVAIILYKFYSLKNSYYTKIILLVACILPIIIIMKSGSRSAFGMLAFLGVGQIIINRSKDFVKSLAIFIVGFIFVFFTLSYVITNTYLGKRILETTRQTEDPVAERTGTIFDKFGDRGIYYVLGYKLFMDQPIRGIGLGNFKNYHGRAVMHPEIMIQLTELGIIGTILFFLFYTWIGKRLFYMRRYNFSGSIKNTELLIVGLVGLLLWMTTGWLYRVPPAFTLIGVMIAHINYYLLKR